jgi:hypothetical protein
MVDGCVTWVERREERRGKHLAAMDGLWRKRLQTADPCMT